MKNIWKHMRPYHGPMKTLRTHTIAYAKTYETRMETL